MAAGVFQDEQWDTAFRTKSFSSSLNSSVWSSGAAEMKATGSSVLSAIPRLTAASKT